MDRDFEPARVRATPERRDRSREIPLSVEDQAALRTIGAFRVVNAKDVSPASVRRLVERGLAARDASYPGRRGERLEVVALTAKGARLARSKGDEQRYHARVGDRRQMAHDAAIYPAYRAAAGTIERAGGRVKRVVLDAELKSRINSAMNRLGGEPRERRREELAREHELVIVNERLALPDCRIEYVDADGRERHQDLEIVTEHYHARHVAGKRASGFTLVAADGGARAKVWDDHHLGFL
ncbi:MAG: hypothetical protein NVS1B14_01700 [Vulcanimicrobiaceae bacterium]